MPEVISKQLRYYRANAKDICKERRKLYHNWKENGLCTKCGQTAIEGKMYCKKHYEAYLNTLERQNRINALGRKAAKDAKEGE